MSRNGNLSIKLLESDRTIKSKIHKAIKEEINKLINRNKDSVVRDLRDSIGVWIRVQPEISSLLADGQFDSLNAQFGLPVGSASAAVNQIVNSTLSSLRVNVKPLNDKLKGGIEFNFQNTDYMNLLGLGVGHIRTELGADLHWLDWLLIQGDTTIVKGYEYSPGNKGRSMGGYMNTGNAWRVPPEYSGTKDNNFITRAFVNRDAEIENILKRLLK